MYQEQGGRRFGGGLGLPLAAGLGGGLLAGVVGATIVDDLAFNSYNQGYDAGFSRSISIF